MQKIKKWFSAMKDSLNSLLTKLVQSGWHRNVELLLASVILVFFTIKYVDYTPLKDAIMTEFYGVVFTATSMTWIAVLFHRLVFPDNRPHIYIEKNDREGYRSACTHRTFVVFMFLLFAVIWKWA